MRLKTVHYSQVFSLLKITLLSGLIILIPFWDRQELFRSYINNKTFIFLYTVIGILTIDCVIFLIKSPTKIRITTLDLGLFLFLIYKIDNQVFISKSSFLSLDFFELIGLSILYFQVRILPKKYYLILIASIIVSGIIQAVYGNLQLYNVYSSHHNLFNITGSFFNPGPYAGYLAMILPISLYLYLDSKRKIDILKKDADPGKMKFINRIKNKNSLIRAEVKPASIFLNIRRILISIIKQFISGRLKLKLLYAITLLGSLSITLVLPATRSRAAWLAAITSLAISVLVFYPTRRILNNSLKTPLKKVLSIALLICIMVVGLAGIYYLKKDSADGRLLIWRVCTEMIKDRPIFGQGANSFEVHYMEYQARFFENNPFANPNVADDISYPFNEFVKVFVELGSVGIIFLLSILFILFKPSRTNNQRSIYSALGLCSLSVFALFSYPTEILPILINMIILLAVFSRNSIGKRCIKLNFTWRRQSFNTSY